MRQIDAGGDSTAWKAVATLTRRSAASRPFWCAIPFARRSNWDTGISHSFARAWESALVTSCPRHRTRSRSDGIGVRANDKGRGTTPAMILAATCASRDVPPSYQAPSMRTAPRRYATALRALANGMSRALQSEQHLPAPRYNVDTPSVGDWRHSGTECGLPHRAQISPVSRESSEIHSRHMVAPPRPHTTHRAGKRMSASSRMSNESRSSSQTPLHP